VAAWPDDRTMRELEAGHERGHRDLIHQLGNPPSQPKRFTERKAETHLDTIRRSRVGVTVKDDPGRDARCLVPQGSELEGCRSIKLERQQWSDEISTGIKERDAQRSALVPRLMQFWIGVIALRTRMPGRARTPRLAVVMKPTQVEYFVPGPARTWPVSGLGMFWHWVALLWMQGFDQGPVGC
jgi:hypothetical protein